MFHIYERVRRKMKNEKHSLVGNIKHASGKYGGFSFGGCQPDAVKVHNPMGKGIEFPNGAKSPLLLTFDVEGNYGNGTGSEDLPVLDEDVGPFWLTSTRIQKRISATSSIWIYPNPARGRFYLELDGSLLVDTSRWKFLILQEGGFS